MVQCKVLKQLQLLEGRKIDDQDIVDDVNFLDETLQASVQDLRFLPNCLILFQCLLCCVRETAICQFVSSNCLHTMFRKSAQFVFLM